MKKISVLIISLVFSLFLAAQNNVIRFNPLGLTFGKYNLQYERMLTDYSSASISGSYIRPTFMNNALFSFLEDFGITNTCNGVAVELDYRLYSKKETGPRGFYIGPYFRYTGVKYITRVEDVLYPITGGQDYLEAGFNGSRTGIGVKFGAQWVIFKHVTIDWNFFGLGADYYSLKVYSEGTITEGGKKYSTQDIEKSGGFFPGINTDFSIGYTF